MTSDQASLTSQFLLEASDLLRTRPEWSHYLSLRACYAASAGGLSLAENGVVCEECCSLLRPGAVAYAVGTDITCSACGARYILGGVAGLRKLRKRQRESNAASGVNEKSSMSDHSKVPTTGAATSSKKTSGTQHHETARAITQATDRAQSAPFSSAANSTLNHSAANTILRSTTPVSSTEHATRIPAVAQTLALRAHEAPQLEQPTRTQNSENHSSRVLIDSRARKATKPAAPRDDTARAHTSALLSLLDPKDIALRPGGPAPHTSRTGDHRNSNASANGPAASTSAGRFSFAR